MHSTLPAERNPHSFGSNKKAPHIPVRCFLFLVEITGPILITVTSCSLCTALSRVSQTLTRSALTKKALHISVRCFLFLVEITGIEPVTSCMPCKRSPS